MFVELKKRPLVGLAVAICAGLVMARIILVFGSWAYEELDSFIRNNSSEDVGWAIFDLAFLVGTAFLIRWIYRKHGSAIKAFFGRHKRGIAFGLFAAFLLYIAVAVADYVKRG